MADNEWTRADATSLRTLLSQPTGQKLVRLMRYQIPKITASDIGKATLEAVRKQGAEDLFDFFLSKAEDYEMASTNAFAAVDLSEEGD